MVAMVRATEAALDLIAKLKTIHGPLMFHQSGGCSYGSAPMCHLAGEFQIGSNDIRAGEIGGCPVYVDAALLDDWKHAGITVDAVPGRGSAFSLETPNGLRFVTRLSASRDEAADVRAAKSTAGL